MSGHSKWSTIKRAKGATDAKRGQIFTKLAMLITMAVKQSGEDPDSNPKLRLALEQARQANLPKDNIQRAIDKGLGKLPGQSFEEVLYEGFGPGKVAVYVEGITDNKMRTTAVIKNLFDRSGGNLGGQGSVAYMFDKKGEIKVKAKSGFSDDEMLELIDLGADDVEELTEEGVQKYLIYVESTQLNEMSNKLTQQGYTLETAEIIYKPNITVEISDKETAEKVVNFLEKLEDQDDVQKVFANANINEEIISQLQ
jgi:YebC/PmpR family DNA-binding regulatory protein